MPWQELSIMDLRREFVALALQPDANRRELCRRFGISAQTGYKWLRRWQAGERDLADRSRRPVHSPSRAAPAVETAVLSVRDAHPAWGARKIAHVVRQRIGEAPAPSTVHAILRRHDRIVPPPGGARADGRFEHGAPNALWQMDFKGYVRLGDGRLCHPLTAVDDHSRYAVCLAACADQRADTVIDRLSASFRRYGLPSALFVDNGAPWGASSETRRWTRFAVWLLKLDVGLWHSRPYHPQGRGKNERFHRTLKDEVLAFRPLADQAAAQRAFDAWRTVYNTERPHQSLDMAVPATRYRPSPRPMPDRLPVVAYGSDEIVRSVSSTKGYVSFRGRHWRVPDAFRGERLAIRPTAQDGRYTLCFAAHPIAEIDLTLDPGDTQTGVNHLPEHP